MELEPTLEVDELGNRRWWLDGRYHRTLGPAVEYADGCRAWYLNGEWYSFQDWLNELDEPTRLLMVLKYGT